MLFAHLPALDLRHIAEMYAQGFEARLMRTRMSGGVGAERAILLATRFSEKVLIHAAM